MTFATLAIGRVKVPSVEARIDGRTAFLTKENAFSHYQDQVVKPAKLAHANAMAAYRQALQEFERSITITESVETRRDTGGLRKTKLIVDQVRVGPKLFEVDAGKARAYVDKLRSEKVEAPPEPDLKTFEQWWASMAKPRRTWRAQFITASGVHDLPLPSNLDWSWGYPVAAAVSQLDRLEAEGWQLVHVSEDRGLYQGEDANDESYPTRVRYLLRATDKR